MKSYFFIFFVFILSGCSLLNSGLSSKSTGSGLDGGVFKSFNSGDDWQQAVLIPSISDAKPNIANVNIVSFAVDPQDRLAIYIGTRENGLYYTYNGAASWTQASVAVESRINAIAIDPKNKCRIYIAVANQVYRSSDCSRSWEGTYVQNDPAQQIVSLVIDEVNNNIIYVGDVKGDVFKSTDFGISWMNIARFKDVIGKIIIDPKDANIIYVATQKKGIQKSVDSGASWVDLKDSLKQFKGANEYRKLILNYSKPNSLLYASRYGLLKTIDGGASWESIPLLTPPGGATIYTLAVNPKNDQEMFYTTNQTLYKTIDGGDNWITKKINTSRIPTELIVDQVDSKILYMFVAAPVK